MSMLTKGAITVETALTIGRLANQLADEIVYGGVDIDHKGLVFPVSGASNGVRVTIELGIDALDPAIQEAVLKPTAPEPKTNQPEPLTLTPRARRDRFVWPRVLQRLGDMPKPFPLAFDFDCEDMNVRSVRGCITRAFHGLANIKDPARKGPVFPGYICKIEEVYPQMLRVLLFKTAEADDAR